MYKKLYGFLVSKLGAKEGRREDDNKLGPERERDL